MTPKRTTTLKWPDDGLTQIQRLAGVDKDGMPVIPRGFKPDKELIEIVENQVKPVIQKSVQEAYDKVFGSKKPK